MSASTKNFNRFFTLFFTVLVILGSVFALYSCRDSTPASKDYIQIESFKGDTLEPTLEALGGLGISYEIVPTQNARPNVVLDVTFDGFEENGVLYIEKNTTVQIHANRVPRDKIVYLTFDDGPTRDNTFEILDILDEYGAKATFFVKGNRVSEYDDRIIATYERGHELGCHSFSHDLDKNSKDFVYQSVDKILSEIDKYESKMIAVLGEEKFEAMPKLFRFPGGSSSNGFISRDEAKEYVAAVRDKGYLVYDWTALTNDADPSERLDGESDIDYYFRILKRSLSKSKEKGLPLIVLMHDKGATKECLREILDFLVSEGYSFDLISNCPEYTFVN